MDSFFLIPSTPYFSLSYCYNFHSFLYIEGSFFLIGGHFGLCKFFFFHFYFLISYYFDLYFLYFCGICVLVGESCFGAMLFFYRIQQIILGVSFGYSKYFRFESRLYRLRVCSIYSVWRLAISYGTVRFSLPVSLFIRRYKKKRIKKRKFYMSVRSLNFKESEHFLRLFKEFRFPDMYSKLGVFVNRDEFEWRNTLRRIR